MPKLMKELILMNEGIPAFPVHQPYYPQHKENVQAENTCTEQYAQSDQEVSQHDTTLEIMSVQELNRYVGAIWHTYKNNHAELKKREHIIARSAFYSYYYALYVLKGPFLKGEEVIAKCAGNSYQYAKNVLKSRFFKGEAAIAKDTYASHIYARDVIAKTI